MKKILSLFAAVLFAGSIMAEPYTLKFNYYDKTDGDKGQAETELAGLFDEASMAYIDADAEFLIEKVYLGRIYTEGEEEIHSNLKFGTSSAAGKLTFALKDMNVEKIVFRAAKYGDSEGDEGFSVNGVSFPLSLGNKKFEDVTFTPEGAISAIEIVQNKESKGRFYMTSITVYPKGGDTPPEPETKPSVAPAAPTAPEDDVMAIFCNSYEKNNAGFGISGWAGAYELLDLDGTIAAYWAAMSWECIIDPAHTDDAHDFSNFKNIHVDMWAPAAAQIKLTAEAVAGGDYKDGQVIDLKKGWNSINIPVADWAGGYDFANLKCFVLEGYSIEGQPFAFTNLYFFGKKGEVLPDPTNCAEAAEAALTVSKNNEKYNDGKEYTIKGFVTEIATEYSEQHNNISFWMADAVDGGQVLQAYRCTPESADKLPVVGDRVEVTGQLTRYNDIPEFAQGCTCKILGEIEPLVKPEAAPAAPAQDEADVMAIFCNHYAENNANFWISGWAGGYEVLDLDGTNVAYWTGMTWECIIDPAHTDDPHDFSNYKTIHIDMWAPLPATIKFTAEAVAGGNYKEGVVLSLGQGWNNFDIEVANWPDGYDFSNLKCFVFENYQNQAGESFEGNPFAFANLYFFGKKSQGIENTTDGVKAVKVIRDGQVLILKGDKTFNVLGTEIK